MQVCAEYYGLFSEYRGSKEVTLKLNNHVILIQTIDPNTFQVCDVNKISNMSDV